MTMLRPQPPPQGRRVALRRPGLVAGILLGYPIALAVTGTALLLSWAPELPDPVATQWSGVEPSSLMTIQGAIALFLALQLGNAALIGGVGVHAIRQGQSMGWARGIAGAQAAISTFTAVLLTASIGLQRGLDAALASDGAAVGVWAGIAAAAAAVAAALAAVLMPRQPEPEPSGVETGGPVLRLGADERVLWVRSVSMTKGIGAALVLPFLVVAALPPLLDGPLIAALLPFGAAVLFGAMLFWRVRVDRRGLMVRSALGLPGWTIDLDDIVEARAIEIDALGEFGGWGVRLGRDGRWGVVMRSGPAIEVRRRSRKAFVVTVDDAAGAAALLNGLREQHA